MDVQAVCDSLVYNSLDSCMTMYRDPIVWNNNQQLLGEEIRVYMNDSTVSRAHVLRQALSVEQMPDTVHFNQVASIDMFAYFNNGEIREAEAVDNVVAAYYVVDDADSTIIGLNRMETSRMKIFLENRKMSKIWTGGRRDVSHLSGTRRQEIPAHVCLVRLCQTIKQRRYLQLEAQEKRQRTQGGET